MFYDGFNFFDTVIEEGFYWEVYGVYELTEAGKKYQEKITREWWTTFG